MNKKFYFLWTTISSSTLALSLYTMTLTVFVLSITNSATLASTVMLCHVGGKLGSSLIFPFLSEKKSLQRILAYALLIQLALYLVITLTAVVVKELPSSIGIPILLVVIVCIGFIDGFVSPSRKALIPETVAQDQIAKANSYVSTADQSLGLLGWSLGPIALNFFSAGYVLGFSALLCLMACLTSLFIGSSPKKAYVKPSQQPKWQVMSQGWSILFSKKHQMRTITTMDILEGVAGGIWIGGITLVFVNEVLLEGNQWWGYINASYYAGSILGGILVTILAHRIQNHLTKAIVVGSFVVSFLVFFYAMNSYAWLALVFVLLMGPFYQLRDIGQQTYVQTNFDHDVLSKVYAAKDNIYYVLFSFSVFIMGFISDYIGVQYVYYFAGVLYLFSSVLASVSFSRTQPPDTIEQLKV